MASQKLFAPQIEGKLPAQVGDTLIIPYLNNRAVGPADYVGLDLKIKTIATNLEIATIAGDVSGRFNLIDNNTLARKVDLSIGQYYKAQLAYIDNNGQVGHYSPVGVFKYTASPEITIGAIDDVSVLMGTYKAPIEDVQEKIYSYVFNIYQINAQGAKVLKMTSGELLHDASQDTDAITTRDFYTLETRLAPGEYFGEYCITTINDYKGQSDLFSIDIPQKIQSNDIQIMAELDANNGVITISANGNQYGDFTILRGSSLDNFSSLSVLSKFFSDQNLNGQIYQDFSIQQGVTYKYYLHDEYGYEYVSDAITGDFYDMLLYDGEIQLNIKFNPKVSSFKETIQESKLDTLGGKFPFFFRNGNIRYKEFQISGLISYHMDSDQFFMAGFENADAVNLSSNNMYAEREFKMAVLSWLNNGQPKLFRSPAEGNYIVRLTNISLTPNDTLGRMLHTFNAAAYEIDDCSLSNLKAHNLLL